MSKSSQLRNLDQQKQSIFNHASRILGYLKSFLILLVHTEKSQHILDGLLEFKTGNGCQNMSPTDFLDPLTFSVAPRKDISVVLRKTCCHSDDALTALFLFSPSCHRQIKFFIKLSNYLPHQKTLTFPSASAVFSPIFYQTKMTNMLYPLKISILASLC